MRLRSAIILALAGALLIVAPANSHDLLIDITPDSSEVLSEGSFEAKLTFNNPLLLVAGESNAQLATKLRGEANWVNHEVLIVGRILTARVDLTEPGEYDLRWKVVSSDGHPISGISKFTLGRGALVDGDQAEGVSAPSLSEVVSDPERSLIGFYIGIAMVVLGVIFAPIGLIIRRRAKNS